PVSGSLPPRHCPAPPVHRFQRSPRGPGVTLVSGSLQGRLEDTITVILGHPVSWGWGGPAPHHQIDLPRHNMDVAARDRAAARIRLLAGMVGTAAAQTGGPGRQAAPALFGAARSRPRTGRPRAP
ncbi:unnamed protein product, partial [Ixodes pacificus]